MIECKEFHISISFTKESDGEVRQSEINIDLPKELILSDDVLKLFDLALQFHTNYLTEPCATGPQHPSD
jgi:hypothetical protein